MDELEDLKTRMAAAQEIANRTGEIMYVQDGEYGMRLAVFPKKKNSYDYDELPAFQKAIIILLSELGMSEKIQNEAITVTKDNTEMQIELLRYLRYNKPTSKEITDKLAEIAHSRN